MVGGVLGAMLGYIFEYPVPIWAVTWAIAGAIIGWAFICESFVRVTFPLSLPGVFAGSLLRSSPRSATT